MNNTLEVIHEDKDILVCRKISGIPVQTAKMGQRDMVSLLKKYRAEKKEAPEIYVVHRLDQPVEGVMVFAKNQKAAASLGRQIQQKSVDKYYYAVVEGIPEPAEGKLENWLLRDGRTNTSKVVAAGTKDAKKAVLNYKVLQMKKVASGKVLLENAAGLQHSNDELSEKTTELRQSDVVQSEEEKAEYVRNRSLVEIQLETGRHHQIRVQMAHAGYPLAGDKKYNPGCQSGYLPIGLCSVRLAFVHPVTGKRMEFSIEPTGEAFCSFC